MYSEHRWTMFPTRALRIMELHTAREMLMNAVMDSPFTHFELKMSTNVDKFLKK